MRERKNEREKERESADGMVNILKISNYSTRNKAEKINLVAFCGRLGQKR